MKRIIYTCDKCGKEITADRYHITICQEVPAGEPELIGDSADRDYCVTCMRAAAAFLRMPSPDHDEVVQEEVIDLSEKSGKSVDPEDKEEPEDETLWALKEMGEQPKPGRRRIVSQTVRGKILEMYKAGKKPKEIADALGIQKKDVYNTIYRAKEAG